MSNQKVVIMARKRYSAEQIICPRWLAADSAQSSFRSFNVSTTSS